MKKYHGGRALLNLPGHHSTAAIVAEIEDTSKWKPGKNGAGDPLSAYNYSNYASLSISDCNRAVCLEIEMGTEEEVTNSLHKLDVMIGALQKLRAGVAIEADRSKMREAWVEARPKD